MTSRRRILLIEDNADNRGLVRQALEVLDVELLEAENGEEGVALALREPPDLILLDLSLPVLSGWDAVRILKADPRTAQVPVVAVTAHAMAGDEQRALACGCDAYLAKPIRVAALIRVVEARLAGGARA